LEWASSCDLRWDAVLQGPRQERRLPRPPMPRLRRCRESLGRRLGAGSDAARCSSGT
jgi:hypothetical protein